MAALRQRIEHVIESLLKFQQEKRKLLQKLQSMSAFVNHQKASEASQLEKCIPWNQSARS